MFIVNLLKEILNICDEGEKMDKTKEEMGRQHDLWKDQ